MASDVVIEVRGGVVVEVYSDLPDLRVKVVDWDEIAAASEPAASVPSFAPAPFAEMPAETQREVTSPD